ncbi:MAG: hypothetical protein C5B58_11015, partial [Acidobacteria bacterium]
PSALGFTKLDSTFLALLGGELRHGLYHHNRAKNQVERSFMDSRLKMADRKFFIEFRRSKSVMAQHTHSVDFLPSST